ncbi:PEP-CTERM sorting domain-containing protein [Colwellia sp. 12G3]|uniref:PEP-CTERM sorting domain-containing protein n=1 Tax=Colwellia sp. 12G3 TaxID=2058299 RepID=UPI000C340875|nr:PEP-CTERM sorting domain-containing protein [Colwellia sp. 12G3]PKI17748.1 hypothetical protein CXF71_02890 [Colwellia sp. 12G3]
MKFSSIVVFAISLFVSTHSSATLLVDVGGVDNFIAKATLQNSGDGVELSWVRDILNDQTITLDDKYTSTGSDWTLIENETDVYSTHLINNPSYFLLKFGVGNTGVDTHLLYENVGDLAYGVIDFSDAGIDLLSVQKFHIGKVSHVDEFDANPIQSQSTPIPEPMTISLFALALLGLSRRKSN